MASEGKKISVVSGAGLLTQVWTELNAEVRRLSGDNAVDHLHRLSTEEGKSTIRSMAKTIVSEGNSGGKQSQRPGLVNDWQMRALEYYIAKSDDATEYAKKVIIWALRQTNSLARSVAVSFTYEWDRKKAEEIAHGVHNINSSNYPTLVQLMFKAMNVERVISFHSGLYYKRMYVGSLPGYTIWIAECHYDHTADLLTPDFAAIEAVDLSWNAILNESFWSSSHTKTE